MTTFRALLLSLLLVAAACGADGDTSGGDGAAPQGGGTAADDAGEALAFSAPSLDGETVDAASFEGSPTVLWFWAPWCVTCRSEAPHIIETAREHDDVRVVGIAGRGEESDMLAFVEETGTEELLHLVDQSGDLWSRFGVFSQPAFAFIDASGDVDVWVGTLGSNGFRERVEALAT